MNRLLRSFLVLSMVLIAECNMCACGVLNSEPFVDAEKDDQGNMVLLDTPRMWRDWTENVDFRVSNEIAGHRPPGGRSTWNDFWLGLIEANEEGRENAENYINYIIEYRQEAGLPPLEGYP